MRADTAVAEMVGGSERGGEVSSGADVGGLRRVPSAARGDGAVGMWECYVCMEAACDPVVTTCGHLFCWECLGAWQVANERNATQPTCPACKAPVGRQGVVPVHGRGRAPTVEETNVRDGAGSGAGGKSAQQGRYGATRLRGLLGARPRAARLHALAALLCELDSESTSSGDGAVVSDRAARQKYDLDTLYYKSGGGKYSDMRLVGMLVLALVVRNLRPALDVVHEMIGAGRGVLAALCNYDCGGGDGREAIADSGLAGWTAALFVVMTAGMILAVLLI